MINGEWGTGKTFFIKDYIKNHENKEKFLYVSLYGIKNIDDISKDIYAQILRKNPLYEKTRGKIKDSKANIIGNIGGRIVIDLCKSKGIDIGGISEIYKTLIDLNKYIFIFDDLERAALDMNEVLGYINSLVEHSNIKAVIIANEFKIEEEKYKEIKEKLIANTVDYKPDIKEVFSILINNIEDKDNIRESLINNLKLIISKNDNNIRTFQFFLSKYRRAYSNILDMKEDKISEELVKKLIEEMYSSAINYKNGVQKEHDIRNLKFITEYIYLDTWNREEVKNIINAYLKDISKEKDQHKLTELSFWYILDDGEVISLMNEIVDDLKIDRYTCNDFAKIIRIVLILVNNGFDTKYLDNIVNEMKKKSFSKEQEKIELFLYDGYFSNNYKENKIMSEQFRDIIGEITKSLKENFNSKSLIHINKALDTSNWLKELEKLLEVNTNNKNVEIFTLCNINKLQSRIRESNNNEIRKFRILFDEIKFKKKDIDFLNSFQNAIDKIEREEKGIIKKVVLKSVVNDIIQKKESLI